MNNSIDQQFVEFVVKSLVSNPDAVQVERRIDEKGVLLELTVDPEDLGRVIGKRGATAQSLRTLLRALGTKNDARYNLKIVDNGVGGYSNGGGDDRSMSSGDDTDTRSASAATSDDDDVLSVPHERESDVVSKTRKELEELDDLDV
jgi:predicted RNA-binding protein YlqC (UPF0109 family)